jgi:hypothetical protein
MPLDAGSCLPTHFQYSAIKIIIRYLELHVLCSSVRREIYCREVRTSDGQRQSRNCPEPEFVNLLRSQEIDFQSDWPVL